MKKNLKSKLLISSLISILLIICLVLPFSVFASDDDYVYTATEEELEAFANTWQEKFIESNTVIQNSSNINEKNYYIIKTLYNFLSDNTLYDNEVYHVKDEDSAEYDKNNNGRYTNSHNAYGAAFGNKIGKTYNWDTYTDSTGLTRIKNYDQGLAVCDGYSQFTKYICTLNGIECENIHGEFSGTTEEEKDRHEWNVIKLYPSNSSVQNESEAKWYYFDATYAATSSKSLKLDEFSFVDYSYFLRGSENKSFTTNHQQLITEFSGLDTNDYKFRSAINIEENKPWVILTRRPNADDELNIENYFFISPENKYYKLDKTDDGKFEFIECNNDIEYNGNGYYYNMNIQNFANGVEYLFSDLYVKDSGPYSLNAFSVDGSKNLYTLSFDISPLDMSKLNGYDSFKWDDGTNQNNLTQSDLENATKIEFRGALVSFSVEIKDVAGNMLYENSNYAIKYLKNEQEISAPYEPGIYYLVIDFDDKKNDNYSGKLRIPFEITKGDFSKLHATPEENIMFGENFSSSCEQLKLESIGIDLKNGTDYTFALQDPSRVNVGDEGNIIYTALPTSKYLKEGTQLKRSYKVSKQYDLSELNGRQINSYYTYTGNAVTPNDFVLQISIGNNQYSLYNNRDYVIISYRNNVNVGTGYVTVQFIGNFCGQAELRFQIIPQQNVTPTPPGTSNQQPSNGQNNQIPQVSISVQDNLTYNGTAQTPSTSVTVNGVALISGVDYSVSALPAGAGAYECSIQGMGQYSYINHRAVVFINPAKITGGNTKPSSTSTVTISWNGQGEKCYYEVYTYDAKKKQWVLVAKTKSTSFKTNYYVNNGKKVKVKGNSQYKYRVRAYYSVSVNGKAYTKYGDFTDISGVTKISAPASPKAKKGKKSFKLSWKKVSNASGYEITYATDSKFKKNKKICKVNKGKTTSATIKKLKAGKTYYVKVRAYQTVNGKKVYSGYTKTVKVKVS